MRNVFECIPEALPEELIETLAESDGVRVERILSRGHSSTPGNLLRANPKLSKGRHENDDLQAKRNIATAKTGRSRR